MGIKVPKGMLSGSIEIIQVTMICKYKALCTCHSHVWMILGCYLPWLCSVLSGDCTPFLVSCLQERSVNKCPVCLLVHYLKCVLWNSHSESWAMSNIFPVLGNLADSTSSLSPFWPITIHTGKLKHPRNTAIKEPA